MYYVKKTIELSASHNLLLNYDSKCTFNHGHNWIINIYCKRYKLNKYGMVIDFSKIKELIMIYDHKNLNEQFVDMNPTTENMAKLFWELIPYCYRVEVQESRDNLVWYEGEKKESYEND